MNLLAITQHAPLLEQLRAAFAADGHRVVAVPDHLHALAGEAWKGAQLMLVDGAGEPLDGYRLCSLLRAESRCLFRDLPVYLILDHAPTGEDLDRLAAADGDGFVPASISAEGLRSLLGPVLEGSPPRPQVARPALLAAGVPAARARQLGAAAAQLGLALNTCAGSELPDRIRALRPPILFLGLGRGLDAAERALRALPGRADPLGLPFPVLVGPLPDEVGQARLLSAGAMDWLAPPLSQALTVHACRRALHWLHDRRIQQECQRQIGDLVERRIVLERESSALRSEALTDPLTGLLNRRAFNQHLEHALNQWHRHRRPFVLILGDLDYFKLVNDRFGHLAGDRVLQVVAQRMLSSLRRSDLAFRIGGEEFAVILSESGLRAGMEVAEKIRRRIDQQPVLLEGGQRALPTISFGLGVPEAEEDAGLFARVDQALYLAKRKGRNRIETLVTGSR
jgi:diguanylate cyclase (GGDEF)-like protein